MRPHHDHGRREAALPRFRARAQEHVRRPAPLVRVVVLGCGAPLRSPPVSRGRSPPPPPSLSPRSLLALPRHHATTYTRRQNHSHGDGHELSFKLTNPTDEQLAPLIAAIADTIGVDAAAATADAIVKTDGAAAEEVRKVMASDIPKVCAALEQRWAALNVGGGDGAHAFVPIAATREAQLLGTAGGENAVTSSAMLQAAALADDGFIPIDSLAAWWIKADWFLAISTFLTTTFKEHVLIEQHESNVRYRLPAEKKVEALVAVAAGDAGADALPSSAVVAVPEGVDAGATFSATTPSGDVIQLTRPADVADGACIQCAVPASSLEPQRIPVDQMPHGLAQIFGRLEAHKEDLNVLEYSGALRCVFRDAGLSKSNPTFGRGRGHWPLSLRPVTVAALTPRPFPPATTRRPPPASTVT